MRKIYSFLFYLAIPYILLRLLWKSRKLPAYRYRLKERFGLNHPEAADIWLHAVSLGEAVAAVPLIDGLLAKNKKILVTTMTPSGSQHITKYFGDRVAHQYLPYDFPLIIRRFFRQVRPKLGIIMETELWPNLISEANRFNIKLFLVNARISDAAFKQYKKVAFFFKPILNKFTSILAQSEKDAKRFIALGANKNLVHNVGNVKFDVNLTIVSKPDINQLKEKWGASKLVLIIASTHDNEEKQWLDQLAYIKKQIPDLLLIIVPRHPERFQTVYQLCQKMDYVTALRSQPKNITPATEILVVDTLGELMHFYRLADFAFVGGSLVPIGGHNVIEPIACNIPVLCGPYMNNSAAICEILTAANALVIAKDINELLIKLFALNKNKDLREQQITNANNILLSNRGVVNKYLEKLAI